MVNIPIHNETTYTLTDVMTLEILRDAHDHFGEEVHAIRVQSGLARHALNARTREVRYAFSPQDFGFGHTMPTIQEKPRSRRRSPRRDEETEETEASSRAWVSASIQCRSSQTIDFQRKFREHLCCLVHFPELFTVASHEHRDFTGGLGKMQQGSVHFLL